MSDWLAEAQLERMVLGRTDHAWLQGCWEHPEAVLLGVGDAAVAATGAGLSLTRPSGDYDPQLHFLLGLVEGRPWFATPATAGTMPLRDVMDSLSGPELEAAFAAAGLVGWHQRAAFCPACGSATQAVASGSARSCPGCGTEHYPRTDPAVIVAIVDAADRLLLGRQPSWPPGRHSVFAGFAEVGESLEQAVHREMFEEVGLELDQVRYLGSQPWPFPRSLMVAFVARARDTRLSLATDEIERARWFTRAELDAALAEGLSLPHRTSIARRMIGAWRSGTLHTSGLA